MRSLLVVLALAACGPRHLETVPVTRHAPGVAFVPQVVPAGARWTTAALTRNGRRALLGDDTGDVVVFDLEHGKLLRILHPHTDRVIAIAMVPGERAARTASRDGSVCLIDLAAVDVERCRRGNPNDLNAGAFSPDGKQLVAGSRNPESSALSTRLGLWAADGGRVMTSAKAHKNSVDIVAWSPDGRFIASHGSDFSNDEHVLIWTPQLGRVRTIDAGWKVFAMTFLPDGRLVTAAQDLIIWDPQSGAELRRLKLDGNPIAMHALDMDRVAMFSEDGNARIVYLGRGGYPDVKIGATISAIAIAGDHMIATSSTTTDLELWSATARRRVRTFTLPRATSTLGTITSTGDVMLGTQGGVIQLAMTTGAITHIPGNGRFQTISRDGTFAVSIEGTRRQLWGRRGDTLVPINDLPKPAGFDDDEDDYTSPVAGHDEPVLFACGAGPGCRVYAGSTFADAATGNGKRTFANPMYVAALSADTRRLAVALRKRKFTSAAEKDDDHGAAVYNTTNGEPVGTIRTKFPVDALALSDDGTRMLAADGSYDQARGYGTRVHLVDTKTGAELHWFHADRDGVAAMAFSRDGKRALLGGANFRAADRGRGSSGSDVTVVDVASGRVVQRLHGHTDRVRSVVFSSDGRHALSSSDDGTSRLWRLDTGYSLVIVAVGADWLIYDEHGTFDASRDGTSLVAAVKADRAFAVDQLAIQVQEPGARSRVPRRTPAISPRSWRAPARVIAASTR